jgi:hypothetical protein
MRVVLDVHRREATTRHPRGGSAVSTLSYMVVAEATIEAVRPVEPGRPPKPYARAVIEAIRAGERIFVPTDEVINWHSKMGRWPREKNMRVHQRRKEHEGRLGYFVWAEPRGEGEALKPKGRRRGR